MIQRDLQPHLLKVAAFYPVVSILGPRQSGKTTLAKMTFSKHNYVSLEDIDMRNAAQHDPRRFLESQPNEYGLIIDEFQNVPDLLSYIQTKVDTEQKQGFFILTGSQNFLMNQAITQSLAGRISINVLLPLSVPELREASLLPDSVETALYNGFYPPIYTKSVTTDIWYADYMQTYLERDMRQLSQVADLSLFQTFVKLCAGRIGQVVNLTSLANDCGISDDTAGRWLSLLETSYIIFTLQPYYKNFSKRLIKSPKIYFYDTGLVCSLLNISRDQLHTHYLKGGIFESFVLSELSKDSYNQGKRPRLYFWRDHTGNEIDCLLEVGQKIIPIEIKAGKTVSTNYFSSFDYWQKITGESGTGYVVYAGSENQKRSKAQVLNWRSISKILSD